MKAYSLLETLLVIAITAIIAMVGVHLIQRQVTRTKVNTTLAQIQFISDAAQTYHGLHSVWPQQSSDDTSFNALLQNCPQWQPTNAPQACYQINSNPQSNVFMFSITIPTTLPDAKQIALMINAGLPNGTLPAGGTTVSIYVPEPVSKAGTDSHQSLAQAPQDDATTEDYIVGIYPFFSNTGIQVPGCVDPTMQRVIYFIASTYNDEQVVAHAENGYHRLVTETTRKRRLPVTS